MSCQFIHYFKQKNIEYASIYSPQRINGKKVNNPQYLGRVINKDRGLFKSKERGVFKYTLSGGFVDADPADPAFQQAFSTMHVQSTRLCKEEFILDFGASFAFFETLKNTQFFNIFSSILPQDADSILSLIGYKVTHQGANYLAYDWWSGDFARILFPRAKLESQRISELLKRLGDEAVQRGFFKEYMQAILANTAQKAVGIIIDSTGLPNAIDFPLAAISTHGCETNRETRLILVVDRKTTFPLFFRYNAGNIVDVSTLKATIDELAALGVKTEFAIVDAGYFSEDNVKDMYERKIAFVTRLSSNRRLYKDLLKTHIDDVARAAYAQKINDRIVHVKKVSVDLFGNAGFAYIAIDSQRRFDENQRYMFGALEDKVDPAEMEEHLKTLGVFMLISSEDVPAEDILPLYYTRQVIEQIFDLDKNNVDLLPLRTHSEETFRGHLMLTFLAAVAFLVIREKLNATKWNVTGAFAGMAPLKCKVYKNELLIKEPTKKMKNISDSLKLKIPEKMNVQNADILRFK